MLATALTLLLTASPAHAVTQALDPQIRVHAGLNVVDGPVPLGVIAGLDSRLTRLVSLDVGGFATPAPIETSLIASRPDPRDYFHLRHGLYMAPGLRIPHRQPRAFAYEVFLRGGGGVIWTANLSPQAYSLDESPYPVAASPGGFVGADALVRVGRLGVRASGKAWMFEAMQMVPAERHFLVAPQWTVEALVQW